MAVQEPAQADRRELKRFVALERQLVGHHSLHWDPGTRDQIKLLSGRSRPADGLERKLLVAENGRPVARCAAIVNRRWQRDNDDLAGHIGHFAAAEDAGAQVGEMLARAEAWLVEQGCDRAIAPSNGGAFHGIGLLTDAHDEEVMFPMPWQPPYYEDYLEQAGYKRAYPLWIYDIDFSSETYRDTLGRALEAPRCELRTIDKSRWPEEIDLMRRALNEGMRDEWEFHQYEREETLELFGVFKPILDPRTMVFAEVDDEPAGVAFGWPDWTPMIRSLHGSAGPIATLKVLRNWRKMERAGLTGIAVLPEFRGRGIGAALLARFFAGLEEMGFPGSLYFYVNDVNQRSRRLAESFGGEGRVLYHCFDKPLA